MLHFLFFALALFHLTQADDQHENFRSKFDLVEITADATTKFQSELNEAAQAFQIPTLTTKSSIFYFKVQKCASATIDCLWAESEFRQVISAEHIEGKQDVIIDADFRIASIRNPLSRVKSHFKMHHDMFHGRLGISNKECTAAAKSWESYINGCREKVKNYQTKYFAPWVKHPVKSVDALDYVIIVERLLESLFMLIIERPEVIFPFCDVIYFPTKHQANVSITYPEPNTDELAAIQQLNRRDYVLYVSSKLQKKTLFKPVLAQE